MIHGKFKCEPTMKVYFGDETKPFEWKTNGILIVHRVSTVILQQVFVYIQSKLQRFLQ